MPEPTKSQVKRAGKTIRMWKRGELGSELSAWAEMTAAIEVIQAFRGAHADPLVTANNGLRSMLRTEDCPVGVSQRLKRLPTIIDKLQREPTLSLSTMQDIGGVRAVLDNVDQIRRLEARLRRNRDVVGYRDYIASPRPSGYRGVHVVVLYGEAERRIEVQLRTHTMHEWATTVEHLSSRVGKNFKGDGRTAVHRYLALVSEAMAVEEDGDKPTIDLVRRIEEARREMQPLLDRSR